MTDPAVPAPLPAPSPLPAISDLVLYQAFGTPAGEHPPAPRAAIITEVHDAERGDVHVMVCNPTGIFFNRVPFSAEGKPGSWRWPPAKKPPEQTAAWPVSSEVAHALAYMAAVAAHEANRAYCLGIGDTSQVPWVDAPEWQKLSATKGAYGVLVEGNGPEESHQSWLDEKRGTGWIYGPVKDAEKKTHPCIVPYDQLPASQKAKDAIFVQTVQSVVLAARTAGMGLIIR